MEKELGYQYIGKFFEALRNKIWKANGKENNRKNVMMAREKKYENRRPGDNGDSAGDRSGR